MTDLAAPARQARAWHPTCDVLVLGAGVAAHQASIAAARTGATVRMVGHAKGASPYILGFNVPLATAMGDSAEAFIEDTFRGGYGLGQRDLIEALASEAPDTFRELAAMGVPFEMCNGMPALRHLSGSRYPRSVFVKSGTGTAIHRALVGASNSLGIERHLGQKVVKLVQRQGRVIGAITRGNDGALEMFSARCTVLALGGIGGLYDDSTYPSDVLGDAFALALDAGAKLRDMEFVQFEPTVVVRPESVRHMEMPTAMLGDGAIMLNAQGERFMCGYNPVGCERQIEKAKMALCIQTEIDEGRGPVVFDATSLSEDVLKGYETHYRRLVNAGIDLAKQVVEIHPAAHSLMGGVQIDAHCRSAVPGLFVCGEAAGGVHGASRVAGNGASDALVLSRIAGRFATTEGAPVSEQQFCQAAQALLSSESAVKADPERGVALLKQIRRTMADKVGIRRSAAGLQAALASLEGVREELDRAWDGAFSHPFTEARNALLVAESITRSALTRQESRGAHFRTDFPESSDAWQHSNEVGLKDNGELAVMHGPQNVEEANEQTAA